MTKSYDYVMQQNTYDCGIASIMTILMYYGIKPSREKIVSKLHKKQEGYTAYDLIKISKSYGIEAYGMKQKIEEVKHLPAIAHTIKDNNMFHFIVILEKNKNTIKIMDPSLGITDITYEEFKKITTDIFLFFEGKKRKKVKDLRFKKEINNILRQNKKIIIKTLILSLIFVAISLIFNYYLKLILSFNRISYLNIIFIIFINISILKNFINYLRNNILLNLSIKIDEEITKKVTNHILNLPYEYFIKKTTGEMLTIIEDIENFKEVITKVFILSIVDLILIVLTLVYICYLNMYIGIILFVIILIVLIITKKYQYTFNDCFIKYKNSKINYTTNLINYITAFETIKNLNISSNIEKLLSTKYKKSLKEDKEYNKKQYKYNLITTLLIDIFYLLIIYIGMIITIKNKTPITDIVLFSSIFYMIINFLSNITESLSLYKVYQTSIDRVLDCLEVEKEKFSKTNFLSINKISLKDVEFENENKKILNKVNLNINKGEKIYITGTSGIGKSTLMKLLLKYYKTSKGNIYIDNINIEDIDLSFIREHITYMGQHEELFPDTILENLKLVCEDENKIKEISKMTLLEQMIKDKKTDYNYLIEESGNNLSGGERKKIILTRGILKTKSILIIDEIFNEISIEEEKNILKNIFQAYQDKIIIMVSHRNSNMNLFDKKYELNKEGYLVEIKQ